ncbi:MAG: DUF4437 domain-containing protein [Cyanobacteria bacterium J06635_13]
MQVLSQSIGSNSQVVSASELQWSPLNPARGDASPQAATIWGDRNNTEATGFLVKFRQGFSSPPHIHNVTYRGVVIDGLVHNDDPKAENMWMPKGSFWTQPAGEAHITSAEEKNNIAYIEIDEGPYLVQPQEEAFDNGERPVNVDASNIVWLNASNSYSGDRPKKSNSLSKPQVAFLWGNPEDREPYGSMIKLPTGFKGKIRSHGSDFRAVVIEGQPNYIALRGKETKNLEPGSYFGSSGETEHEVFCQAEEECILYVRAQSKFDVVPI